MEAEKRACSPAVTNVPVGLCPFAGTKQITDDQCLQLGGQNNKNIISSTNFINH